MVWGSNRVRLETRDRLKLFTRTAKIYEECWEDGPQLSVHLTFLYIFAPSMFAVHELWVKKSVVRVLLLHSVEDTSLWSRWTCVCQESLVERIKSCELSDGWQIGRDRRQSESVHSVNKIQALSSMIGAMNASRMQTVYVRRARCAYRLSLEQNLRERRSGAAIQLRDLINLSCVRICVLLGCSIRLCTLLFRLHGHLMSTTLGIPTLVRN